MVEDYSLKRIRSARKSYGWPVNLWYKTLDTSFDLIQLVRSKRRF